MAENYLIHHGILGQKWGVRRYQNKDGTRTSLGKKRYKSGNNVISTAYRKRQQKTLQRIADAGSHKGTLSTAARAASIGLTGYGGVKAMTALAATGSLLYAAANVSGHPAFAQGIKWVTTAAWAGMAGMTVNNIRKNVQAEVYSRSDKYKEKIDSKIEENKKVLNNGK